MSAAAIERLTGGTTSPPMDPRPVDLASISYVEEEWCASGTAAAFAGIGPLGTDGHWSVEPTASAPYRTRFIVRQPADLARWSGTVVLEWFNVSGGMEVAAEWAYVDSAIVDAGAVWVGLSTQALGVVGGIPLLGGSDQPVPGLRDTGPARYGELRHPGDAFAFDIFSQVAAALRSAAGAEVLGGRPAERIVGAGQSQSAAFLVSYINAAHPVAGAFDGFFVHSRGSGAAGLDGTPVLRAAGDGTRIRTDLDVPVLTFETETDVAPVLGFADARQPDGDRLRTWEVAGTGHADAHFVGEDFDLCSERVNNGPHHFVAKAAVAALLRWVDDGVAPPAAAPISTSDGQIERDHDGIARGGIRTPAVDVPVGTLSGEGNPDDALMCQLFGSSRPFEPSELRARYGSTAAYLQAFASSLRQAVEAGFIRPEDTDAFAADADRIVIGG